MNLEMGVLLAVLLGMAILFFTEKLPVELTAFIGLVLLTLGGYASSIPFASTGDRGKTTRSDRSKSSG